MTGLSEERARAFLLDRVTSQQGWELPESRAAVSLETAAAAMLAFAAEQQAGGWRAIESAPKDGTIIWACFHPRIYPDLRPGREDLERWNGVQVPLRLLGIFVGSDGKPFDMGWNVAAPVGNGGFPDDWIVGWRPTPTPPTEEARHG